MTVREKNVTRPINLNKHKGQIHVSSRLRRQNGGKCINVASARLKMPQHLLTVHITSFLL